MKYYIVIPTYNRIKLLQEKTLKLLEKHKIPKTRIILFVSDENQMKEYRKEIKQYKIEIGKKGLKNQRNIIQDYFPEGTNIVQMDDDINELYELYEIETDNKYKRKQMKPLKNLNEFIINAFNYTKQKKLYIWGVYPIDNPYFMYNKISDDLKLIVGPFYGIINRHDNSLKNTIDEKEDVERTLIYYKKDKGVIRFNNIAVQTNYYKNLGGMGLLKTRIEDAKKSIKYLLEKYPEYCKLRALKKSGMPDIKLLHNK